MATLTATSWTVTILDSQLFGRAKKYKRVTAKITPAAGEVPLTGIPLPASQLGMTRFANYVLHTDHGAVYATAAGAALKWNLNVTGKSVNAYKYSTATLAASPSGGRFLRKLATTVEISSTAHVLYITAKGY